MALARAVLVLAVLAFAGFGIMLLIWPERLAGVGLQVDTALARIEVRGFYGGLELGIAAFLAWCATSPHRFRPGLTLAALALGGTAAGRLVGIALEGGTTTGAMWSLVALELTGVALSVVALRALSKSPA